MKLTDKINEKIKSLKISHPFSRARSSYLITIEMESGKVHKVYASSYDYALDTAGILSHAIRAGDYDLINWDII